MPRISNFETLSLPPFPVLRTTARSRYGDLPSVIGGAIGAIGAVMKEAGGALCDVPFMAFRDPDPDGIQITVTFPLVQAVAGNGKVEAATHPAEMVVFCMYLGPYDGIEPVYREMQAWVGERGYPVPTVSYEYYYNGQEYPEEFYLTKLAMPLAWRR